MHTSTLQAHKAHLTLCASNKNFVTSQVIAYMKSIHAFENTGQVSHSQKSSKLRQFLF